MRNLEAEQAVIGSVFLDPGILAEVRTLVVADDFADEYREIFLSMCRVADAGENIDEITVTNELRARGRLDEAGGAGKISATCERIPSAANVATYAGIIRTLGRLRRLRDTAHAVALACTEASIANDDEARTWFADAQAKLVEASAWASGARVLTTREVLRDVMKFAQEREEHRGQMLGWPTGFSSIDEKLLGLRRKRLHVVAAKTGVGKTAMALNMARAAAAAGAITYVVSLEMGVDELGLRLASSISGVPGMKIERGEMDPSDFARLARGVGDNMELPIWWPTNPPSTITGVRSECQFVKRKHGLDLLVVDYLQLVSARADSREREVAEVSRGLKLLASELDIAVVSLSQLNRKQDRHAEPELADLRDSGSIEQDANAVLFLWTPSDDVNAEVNWKLAKNRGGFLGGGTLTFRRAIQRFEER